MCVCVHIVQRWCVTISYGDYATLLRRRTNGGLPAQRGQILFFFELEPVCCKKVPGQFLVCGIGELWSLKDLNDSKLIAYESKGFSLSSRINFIPFKIVRGPLFYKSLTGQEPFFLLFLTANRLYWFDKIFTLNLISVNKSMKNHRFKDIISLESGFEFPLYCFLERYDRLSLRVALLKKFFINIYKSSSFEVKV